MIISTTTTSSRLASRSVLNSIGLNPRYLATNSRNIHRYFAPSFISTSTFSSKPASSLAPSRIVSLNRSLRLLSTSSRSLSPTAPPNKDGSPSTEVAAKKGTRLQKIWAVVKKEAIHYWHGTKLLGKEIRISARIQGRLLAGKKLTRREHRQLKRTTQDLLRLIPFSVFLVIPFMELLLPVALKLFPNMLPSTFEDKFQGEEKKRKLLKVRLEMAKFLQETIRETGMKSPDTIKESADFKEFFRKVRSTGEAPTTDEVVNVAKLFEGDLTLDNLSRPQLVSMCRYMNVNAFGTDNFLRYTVRTKMNKIKADDAVIESEGIATLILPELQAACQSRGIRTLGVAEEHLRSELSQWLDLHLHRGLSGTLLILSKAFSFNQPAPGSEEGDDIMRSLKDTLASLPDNLVNETELEVSSDSASNKQRLEVLQQQEELIEDEEEQEAKEAEARKLKKEAEEEAKEAESEALRKEKEIADELLPPAEVAEATIELPPTPAPVDPENIRMTSEQITELGHALEILTAKSSVIKERTELRKLIEENEIAEVEGAKPSPLAKRIKGILTKIDKQLEEYDAEVGGRLNMFQTDSDGRIEVKDLKRALEVIRHRPSDEAIDVLIEKLDVDHDSFVPLDDIIKLAEGEGLGIVIDADEAQAAIEESTTTIIKDALASKAPFIKEEVIAAVSDSAEGIKKDAIKKEKKELKKEDIVSD